MAVRQRSWFTPIALAAILFLALAVRVAWALQPRSIRWDEPDYLLLARSLLRGSGYRLNNLPELHTPPLGPYLAALAVKLGAPLDAGMLVWHVVAGAVLVGVLYGLTRDLTGRRGLGLLTALLAAMSSALAVQPLYWGSMTESLFMAWLFAGLWAAWRALGGEDWKPYALAGLAFGFSYLTRPEGLIWWAWFAFILAGVTLYKGRYWRPMALYLALFLTLALPYLIYLYQHTGHIILSGKTGLTAAMSVQIVEEGNALGNDYGSLLDSTGEEILWFSPERFEISMLGVIRSDPAGALRRILVNVRKAAQAMIHPLLGPVLAGLAAFGLWARPWSKARILSELFLLAALLPLGVVPLFHAQPRLLVPWVPIALIWAARGLDVVMRWAGETLAPWPKLKPWGSCGRGASSAILIVGLNNLLGFLWAGVILLAVVGMMGKNQVAAAQAGQRTYSFSHNQAARWLAENAEPDAVIMTRNAEIGVYADRAVIPLPNAHWPQILAYGRARHGRYLVIDDWEMRTVRPQLQFLSDPATAPPEVRFLISFTDPNRTTFIYTLLQKRSHAKAQSR
ncbi:MAG TPA: hypothetical protein EYP25_03705 [Anaerolineae bacterium]|nr:hypothetical protein [Caldilineae bacterium]HID33669.1 hypothetical protein [Anaerolineae bacterium]